MDGDLISDGETTSYLPPSMLEKRLNWDVFLSFRGEDTRHSFTTLLRDKLKEKGLRPFMDDEGMERGDTIQPTLEEAIVDSALAVAIISPRYADSRWCLHELSRIFECKKRVIPVFYDVDPSDVRRQRGKFGDGFKSLVEDDSKGISQDDVKNWKCGLVNVGNISGYTFTSPSQKSDSGNNGANKDNLIRRIVQQVWNELKNTPEYVVKLEVGLDSRVDKVIEKLDLRSGGVRFLGIHGTPGIGKTTLAKAVYNKLVVSFTNRSFIANVRENLANEDGLLSIQTQLIKDLSLTDVALVKQAQDGMDTIKKIVNQNRVLVVLDDVYEDKQLEKLGIFREWFEVGSRVIVTSRNIDALSFASDDTELHEAQTLDDQEALELFSIHALGRREPTKEFWHISKKIVSLTGGLPLALEVFGSSLVKRTLKEWEDEVIKLGVIRPDSLQMVLKLSYDGLDEHEKTVFLDISCLLLQMRMKKEDVVDILVGCDLRAESAIGNLVRKSLLKISDGNLLRMHDQIRDMGRQIVQKESIHDIGKRSRLWDSNDTFRVLRQKKVTEAVRGITLDIKKPPDVSDELKSWTNFRKDPNVNTYIRFLVVKIKRWWYRPDESDISTLQTKWFEKMVHLKLLQMNYAKVQGDFKYMPSELRWLQWKGCQQKTFPANIPEEIRVLDLSSSNIERLWSSYCPCLDFNKVVGNLVVINLSYCPRLTVLPDMSAHKNLKKLMLVRCVSLTSLHHSVGNMSSLVHLNLHGCTNLVALPIDVTGMKSLKELNLSDCSKFKGLPEDIWSMTSLIDLNLDSTIITKLPESVFRLTQLEVLSLNSRNKITELPDCIGCLTSLKELYISSDKLENLPPSVGSLTNLEILCLGNCSLLTALPDTVGNLKSLNQLLLYGTSIGQLPDSIRSLCYLKVLSLGRCRSLLKLPVSVEGLAFMHELYLDHTPIQELPDEICSLKFIKKIQMTDCTSLKKLPKEMGKMSNLSVLFIVGAAITELPMSFGELESLSWLKLTKCTKLRSLPESFGELRSLRILEMEETAITALPGCFGFLYCLRVLKMRKSPCDLPESFWKLSNLQEFDAQACGISGQIHDKFSELSKLESLNLGYNSFHSLPSTMEGMFVLKKLVLRHCKMLRVLPKLPSTLEELNAADCHSLESICDISNLERLQELQLVNCNKIIDVPGIECLKSLRRLFLAGCNSSSSAVRRRLTKATLRNLTNMSIPGSEIPEWFSQTEGGVKFNPHPNLSIQSVIVIVILSVDIQALDSMRAQLPGIVHIQAGIIREETSIFSSVLNLTGLPCTPARQIYLCRFKYYHPMILLLKEGDIIQVGYKSGSVEGVELKKWGIHLVYENDDDYEGDEDLLPFNEIHQSISQRLVCFLRSLDQR
ncbi:unnamed protein product [Amaranthus hypochondriacus]